MFFIQLQANVLDLSFCNGSILFDDPSRKITNKSAHLKGSKQLDIGFLTSLGREFLIVTVF